MQKTVVALGTFDGVHLGHRALLARAADLAHANGDEAVAFTFSNHPRELFGDSVRLWKAFVIVFGYDTPKLS